MFFIFKDLTPTRQVILTHNNLNIFFGYGEYVTCLVVLQGENRD